MKRFILEPKKVYLHSWLSIETGSLGGLESVAEKWKWHECWKRPPSCAIIVHAN